MCRWGMGTKLGKVDAVIHAPHFFGWSPGKSPPDRLGVYDNEGGQSRENMIKEVIGICNTNVPEDGSPTESSRQSRIEHRARPVGMEQMCTGITDQMPERHDAPDHGRPRPTER